MASERDNVLNDIAQGTVAPSIEASAAPSLTDALAMGEDTRRLQLTHQHAMDTLKAELGWFGKVFGNESHAAIVIAFIVVLLGFATAIGLWWVAAHSSKPEYWTTEAHLALGTATAALAYVFGKTSRDSSK